MSTIIDLLNLISEQTAMIQRQAAALQAQQEKIKELEKAAEKDTSKES
jgi:uncharacterized coiled-coil protein SlyX